MKSTKSNDHPSRGSSHRWAPYPPNSLASRFSRIRIQDLLNPEPVVEVKQESVSDIEIKQESLSDFDMKQESEFDVEIKQESVSDTEIKQEPDSEVEAPTPIRPVISCRKPRYTWDWHNLPSYRHPSSEFNHPRSLYEYQERLKARKSKEDLEYRAHLARNNPHYFEDEQDGQEDQSAYAGSPRITFTPPPPEIPEGTPMEFVRRVNTGHGTFRDIRISENPAPFPHLPIQQQQGPDAPFRVDGDYTCGYCGTKFVRYVDILEHTHSVHL